MSSDVSEEINLNLFDSISAVEHEDVSSDTPITDPFDPTLIRVETKPLSVDLLIARLREGEIDLAPDFQRKAGIWSDGAQSRLIESLLIRIPLPAFYMDATDDDHWIVVDGLQRLTTLRRFVLSQDLELTGLEFLKDLNGLRYSQLSRTFQRRIGETQITLYLIEKGTPPEVKFNIFKRINTGGLPLSAQEIRHALNQGPATELLRNLAATTEFTRATCGGIRDERMADRECVLRFLAFRIYPWANYSAKDFDQFLNRCMSDLNKMTEQAREVHSKDFVRAMAACELILGRDAFRKRYALDAPRYPINKALFEAWSVNIAALSDHQIENLIELADELRIHFIELMNTNRDFDTAVSQGTGDVNKVQTRFREINRLIREVLS